MASRMQALRLGTDLWDPSHRFETSWLIPPWILFGIRAAIVGFDVYSGLQMTVADFVQHSPSTRSPCYSSSSAGKQVTSRATAFTTCTSRSPSSPVLVHPMLLSPFTLPPGSSANLIVVFSPLLLGPGFLLRALRPPHLFLRLTRWYPAPQPPPTPPPGHPLPPLDHHRYLPVPRNHRLLGNPLPREPFHNHFRTLVQHLRARS